LGGIARQLPSTHRPDETLVFVPENRAARLKRERRNRRALIAALISCLVLAVTGVLLKRSHDRQKVLEKSQRREVMARRELDTYAKSLEVFRVDVGRYPTKEEGLGVLVKRDPKLASWRGPYVDGDYSTDPWGNEYLYETENYGLSYKLSTYGPEGEGGKKAFLQVNSETTESLTTPTPAT
jgi:general secretion pathway protein G